MHEYKELLDIIQCYSDENIYKLKLDIIIVIFVEWVEGICV